MLPAPSTIHPFKLLDDVSGVRIDDDDVRSDVGSAVSDLSAYGAASVTAGPSSVAASTVGGRGKGGKKKKKKQNKIAQGGAEEEA